MAINYALASNGSSATATNHIGGYEPSKLIDGTLGAYYHSSTLDTVITCEIDFGQSRDINQIVMKTNRSDGSYNFSYDLDYWNGSSWTNLVNDETLPNVAATTTKTHNFTAVSATKIRLVSTTAYVTINELEAWGDPPAPPTCDAVTFALSIQDAFGILGTIGECEAVNFALSIQDIDGFITEAPPDLATLWTSSFVEERTRYFVSAPDFEAVTRNHEYEDAGKSFNELSDNPPQQWEIVFRGKTQTWAAILDSHFAEYRFSRPFDFLAKDGETYSVYYKEYSPNHEAHKSWIQERRVVLIKYP